MIVIKVKLGPLNLGIKAVLKILLEKSTKIYQTNSQHWAGFPVGYRCGVLRRFFG